ncbi:MAG: alkyl hydroperoxide reductase/Thiol specific antioxidant/Mal allergen [Ferruginibacter sp.]|uniref:redoxin family protein n=1 Tax=Ferruginibacter sp. TaxID=1940288 RepID=UPI00265A14DA|nr:redoxin family protein [Ferruginibacter sp.]MDB5277301.1 alkyl hydroperoxide reductase/Thiol specific antioxidant/Mal allergen [Ferruginibacter sp.]
MQTLKYCLLSILWPVMNGLAQAPPQRIHTLTVGDRLPDIVLHQLYNYPVASVSLSQLKAKGVILDFWSTWCGSCLESFPEMHALQQKFAGALQVIMVNNYPGDDAKLVDNFMRTRKKRSGQAFTLSYLLQDTVLNQYFPYRSIPHYVWLDEHRRVAAITGQEELTATNIQALLEGKPLALHVKNDDLLFDVAKNDLVKSDSAAARDFLYRSLITGYKEDLGAVIGKLTTEEGKVYRYYIINYSLLQLYQLAFADIQSLPVDLIFIDPAVQPLFFEQKEAGSKKLYCYDLTTRPVEPRQITHDMRTDLERYFNATAKRENRSMECYVLSANAQSVKCKTRGGTPAADLDKESLNKYIRNGTVADLTATLSMILNKPWIDETGLKAHIDIIFPYDFYTYNLRQVKAFLLGYGLVVNEAARTIPVGVISPIP